MKVKLGVLACGLAVVALAFGGCGAGGGVSNSGATGTSPRVTQAKSKHSELPTTPTVAPAKATAGKLLDRWTGEFVPILVLLRQRSQAAQAGDRATDQRIGTQIRAQLQAAKKWGRDARRELLDVSPGALRSATVAAGDAWSQGALLLDTDKAIDYTQGARISDAAAEALRQMRLAYRLSGRSLPRALQSSGG